MDSSEILSNIIGWLLWGIVHIISTLIALLLTARYFTYLLDASIQSLGPITTFFLLSCCMFLYLRMRRKAFAAGSYFMKWQRRRGLNGVLFNFIEIFWNNLVFFVVLFVWKGLFIYSPKIWMINTLVVAFAILMAERRDARAHYSFRNKYHLHG